MTAREVRKIREARGETQLQFSKVLGVTEHSVWRWEAGMHHVSGPASRLIRLLAPSERLSATA